MVVECFGQYQPEPPVYACRVPMYFEVAALAMASLASATQITEFLRRMIERRRKVGQGCVLLVEEERTGQLHELRVGPDDTVTQLSEHLAKLVKPEDRKHGGPHEDFFRALRGQVDREEIRARLEKLLDDDKTVGELLEGLGKASSEEGPEASETDG